MKIKDFKIGATRKFPQGKIDQQDEGELRIAITADTQNRVIRIIFGKSITWLGLPINETRQFIALLQEKIQEIEKGGN